MNLLLEHSFLPWWRHFVRHIFCHTICYCTSVFTDYWLMQFCNVKSPWRVSYTWKIWTKKKIYIRKSITSVGDDAHTCSAREIVRFVASTLATALQQCCRIPGERWHDGPGKLPHPNPWHPHCHCHKNTSPPETETKSCTRAPPASLPRRKFSPSEIKEKLV